MERRTAILLAFCCALAFCAPAWACGCDAKAKTTFTERVRKSVAKIAANVEKLEKKVKGN